MNDEMDRQALAKRFGLPIYTDLNEWSPPRELLEKVPYHFVKRHTLLPLEERDGRIIVAVNDPLDLESLEELHHLLNRPVESVYSPKEVIIAAIHTYYDQETGAASEFIADLSRKKKRSEEGGEMEVYDLLEGDRELAPVIRMLNLILTEAIQQNASDIHFEPHEGGLRIRYRIDGVLQNRHAPAAEYQMQLLTRIKVMAKMDIAEHRLPQDGRIKLRMGQREVDFRVSTVPVMGGERIVMRILDKGKVLLGLNMLGMLPATYREFQRLIALPEGIILVTGPTGSGKTTTLYSAICAMDSGETNIMTIEDPVEYNIKGIAQIGVRPKIQLNFATGLRHILRQDPDVIMIGEIRDKETAEIAIQAALTGHLVLSTLHTNDAPSAVTRLVDMGVEPYLITSSLIGVLAQRLVRRICPNCKMTYLPTEDELAKIGLKKESLEEGVLFRGKGCPSCFGSGYSGRHGLYELMPLNNALKKQIVRSPDAIVLRKIAIETGMLSLFDHGAQLVCQGVTTIAEVLRVTRGVEED